MKRSIVSILILLAVFFALTKAFGAAGNNKTKLSDRSKASKYVSTKKRRPRRPPSRKWDPNAVIADVNFMADPNAIRGKVKQFRGLEQALKKLDKASRNEYDEWRSCESDEDVIMDRRDLARAVQKQLIAELAFIRELALEEKATKTAAAIEGLLLDKQQRYAKVLMKLETKIRKMKDRRRARKRDEGRDKSTRYRAR